MAPKVKVNAKGISPLGIAAVAGCGLMGGGYAEVKKNEGRRLSDIASEKPEVAPEDEAAEE